MNEHFKPSRRVTVSEIIKMDVDDESLQKYKKALLGDIDESALKGTERIYIIYSFSFFSKRLKLNFSKWR